MKRRYLITGFLIATLALGGCTNTGNKTENNKNVEQTQSNTKSDPKEVYISDLGVKYIMPKTWEKAGIQETIFEENEMAFQFISSQDLKSVSEMTKKIESKKVEDEGVIDEEAEGKLMDQYMKKMKNIGYIAKLDKNKASDLLKSEEYSKYSKKDKIGEMNNYEYYFIYNDKVDDSNLSDASKAELKNIESSINEFKESIKIVDPAKEKPNKTVEKAEEQTLNGTVEFKSKTIQGKNIDSSIFKNNKLTMINIWGTYCGPCIDEMPELQELYKEVKANNVNVIGIVSDTPDEENELLAKSILDKTGAKFDNVIPDKGLYEWISKNVKGTPTTIFVDKDGKIVGSALVGSASKDDYKAKIDEVLKSIK
ncbi:TlpA family protein disulfide reductase [[Clostridium] dakarense]|uniref:TlpA family protein disulfide reductase n=1 Tax=Faecalimicrobium dakarense TaxID=1301100 RepID=UPI0004BA83DD|nr:TlpA disulfide reductase family protein [[Clostridium] dakarense]